MNLRDKIKAAVQAHQSKPAAAPTVAAKPAQPKPPAEIITHLCGHVEAVGNIRNRPCPACSKVNQQRKRQKNAERRANNQGTNAANAIQRLPNDSEFHAVYDAANVLWTGKLVIGGEEFVAQASGVKGLLHQLDAVYRRSLMKGE